MGKYGPLAEHLRELGRDEWEPSFAEIEQVLGFPLPPSARKYREWWGNQSGAGHSQASGWQDAGWKVSKVDLPRERVLLQRRASNRVREEAQPFEAATISAGWDDRSTDELFARARELTGISDRESLIREGLCLLVAREAGLRLARLGGTMPDFKAPSRERPSP